MKTGGIVLSLLLCASLVAKEAKVRRVWTRSFQNTSLSITPDNQGHIAAFGSDTNSGIILLLGKHGRQIRKVSIPIPEFYSAVADNSGRIFVTGHEYASSSIHCAAFAPGLSKLLWVQERNMSNAYSPPFTSAGAGLTVPDDNGAAYVFGSWHHGFYLTEFQGTDAGLLSIWDPYSGAARWPVAGTRSPSGDIFFVAAAEVLHYPWVVIQKLTPATQQMITVGLDPPSGAYSLPTAAACDSEGNLIVAGWYTDDPHTGYGLGNGFVRKMDANLNIVWQARRGPYSGIRGSIRLVVARTVAVDKEGEIVVTGDAGTAKYNPDGTLRWESAQLGEQLQLDEAGNVYLGRRSGRDDGIYDLEITKLNAAGVRSWQTYLLDPGINETWLTGLIVDQKGNVYVGKQTGDTATIVKLHEIGTKH